MDNLVFAGIAPHPPIVVPEVGKGEGVKVVKTARAIREWAESLKNTKPDLLVMISPHGPVFRDAIAVMVEERLAGSMARFGAGQVQLTVQTDIAAAEAIMQMAGRLKVPTVDIDKFVVKEYGGEIELDHGVLVPLYYLREAGVDVPMVSVAMGMLPFEELYSFGVAVQKAARLMDKRVALVASGDLSHRLTPEAPAGYNPKGAEFDDRLIAALETLNVRAIRDMDPDLVEKAGECGLRPIIMMLGALDGLRVETKIHSYEGPFGVGYLVASFKPQGISPERQLLDNFLAERRVKTAERRGAESALVQLARHSLEYYVREGKPMAVPGQLTPEMEMRAGVFVSIKKHGQLRGCIGTTGPTRANVAQEIIHNAISAGTGDPRFLPVTEEELDDLVYSVDVLKEPEPIESTNQLDVKRYGVIVRSGRRSGLLLPNLEGIDTVEEQIRIAKQKAGIGPHEPVEMERFEVIRYY